MKNTFLQAMLALTFLSLASQGVAQVDEDRVDIERPRIGLALGGGGARGAGRWVG